jgi:hypothetical protein
MRFKSAIAATIIICGCDALRPTPGLGFELHVVSETPIVLRQSASPVDVKFTLGGCNHFTMSVAAGGNNVHPLSSWLKQADGSFLASVPVSALTSPGQCGMDEEEPLTSSVELIAHCDDDGRTVKSGPVEVSYAPSWRTTWRNPYGSAQYIFPGADPGSVFSVGGGWLTSHRLDDLAAASGAYGLVTPLEPALLARHGERVYLWGGCPFPANDCPAPTVSFPGGTLQIGGSYLYGYELREHSALHALKSPTLIPGSAGDLAFETSGTLAILSRAITPTLVTRLDEGKAPVTVALTNEADATAFSRLSDGSLVFVTCDALDPSIGRLRRSDGSLVVEFSLPGSGKVELLSLAPTAKSLDPTILMKRNGNVWLGSAGGAWSMVSTELVLSENASGLAWLEDAVVLWSGAAAEAFELTPDHPRRYRYLANGLDSSLALDGAAMPVGIVSATGVGRSVLLTTATGVRLIDPTGQLRGGADPLPCHQMQGRIATAALDDHTVAVTGGEYLYVFDLSRYSTAGQ